MNNSGRQEPVKLAFTRYIMRGIDEMLPITPALEAFTQKPRAKKLMVCPSRMVDAVQEMLNTYRRQADDKGKASDAPLPVMFLAFAKDSAPIPTDRGRSVADFETLRLVQDGDYYRVRMQNKELRAQLVFAAHENETATAMTDQMRLYLQRFQNHRWLIDWQHDGVDFTTVGTFEDGFEPADMVIDVDGGERKNITIYAWDLTLNFILPFVGDKVTGRLVGTNIETNGAVP